jgi:hypothetical protein
MASIWNSSDIKSKIIQPAHDALKEKHLALKSVRTATQKPSKQPNTNAVNQIKILQQICILTLFPSEIIAQIGRYLQFEWCCNLWRCGNKSLQSLIKKSVIRGDYQFILSADYLHHMLIDIPVDVLGKHYAKSITLRYDDDAYNFSRCITIHPKGITKIIRKIPKWWQFTLLGVTRSHASHASCVRIRAEYWQLDTEIWKKDFLTLMMLRNKSSVKYLKIGFQFANILKNIPSLSYPFLHSIEFNHGYLLAGRSKTTTTKRIFRCHTMTTLHINYILSTDLDDEVEFPNLENLYVYNPNYIPENYICFASVKNLTFDFGGHVIFDQYHLDSITKKKFEIFNLVGNMPNVKNVNFVMKFFKANRIFNTLHHAFMERTKSPEKICVAFLFLDHVGKRTIIIDTRKDCFEVRSELKNFVQEILSKDKFCVDFKFET